MVATGRQSQTKRDGNNHINPPVPGKYRLVRGV